MAQQKLYTKEHGVPDLVLLEHITEEEILKTLKTRHAHDLIYTYIGPVLISVNPFKNIAGLYTATEINNYRGRYMYELPPHVYALAEDTFRQLLTDTQNQTVIITGESGAGKTEASKKIMQYIASVCGGGGATEIERVKDQLLKTNPVLEAFGNAKTVRNNNSSRFGKYMEIFFNFRGDPCGGKVTNYLLEKSRVVNPANSERSFHVFYQLTSGVDEAQRRLLHLKTPDQFHYLHKSGCYTVDTVNDREDYAAMVEGMTAMGMSDADIEMVFRTVSTVLWLGQVEFTPTQKGEHCELKSTEPVKIISELVHCEEKALLQGLTHRTIEAGGGQKAVLSTLNVEKALYTRDALAKTIYCRLFDYIVHRVNQALSTEHVDKERFDPRYSRTIGVLDIYGFEIFTFNSFEQFCINFVNEKLQQIFIEKTLKSEQEEYRAEGIQWTPIEYFNNKIVCDLFESRPKGIWAFCDEECLLPKGSDESFLAKLEQNFKGHAHFERVKGRGGVGGNEFQILHYAGGVEYNIAGFLDKNKDLVWKDLLRIGESAKNDVWTQMFPAGGAAAQGLKRPDTAGTQFKNQVNALMDTLSKANPHYIRCIKPNDQKKAGLFQDDLNLHQVRYLGLLENVRVRRAGFAFRQPFAHFIKRYKMICPATWPKWEGDEAQGVREILTHNGITETNQFQLGKTKAFIRQPQSLFHLEELREKRIPELVVLIQKVFRSWKARKFFLELREKSLGLFGRNKQRRKASVKRFYVGDYLGIATNEETSRIMAKNGDHKVMFADMVEKLNRKNKVQTRAFLLTEKGVYNLGDGHKGHYQFKRRIDLAKIAKVSVSKLSDNFFVLHVAGEYDYVYKAERKTELLTALAMEYQLVTGRPMQVDFTNSITYLTKQRKEHHIEFKDDHTAHGVKLTPLKGEHLLVGVGPCDIVSYAVLDALQPAKMHKTEGAKQLRAYGFYGAGGYGAQAGGPAKDDHKQQYFEGRQSNMRGLSIKDRSAWKPARDPPKAGGGGGGHGDDHKTTQQPLTKEVWARAKFDFDAKDARELGFKKGDVLRIHEMEADGWWSAELKGKLGYVPDTFVEVIRR